MPTEAPVIDLLSVDNYAGSQPHELFAWLRENDPVHRHAEPRGPGFWAVTRYEDVRRVGREPETFSSVPTIMIDDPDDRSALMGDHQMMLMADPPVHTRMRRLVSKRFTPKASAALQPRVDALATQIVDAVAERGECDLVADLAGEMPSYVIADVLGIPLEDGRVLYHHTEALHSSRDVVGEEAQAEAFFEMFTYASEVYAAKRADPSDDLASLLANAALDGEPVDEIDFFLWFLLLVDAGGDTTRNLVGAGLHALFEHPAELALLQAHVDGLLPTAIEEMLRWTSPVIYMRRTATTDTELAGQPIAAGDKVVVYYGAANRDPAAFDEPDRLDLGRTPNPHVAFGGGGPHFCLGAHLARVEIAALLREMLTRLHDLEPTAEPSWMSSNFIFGPTRLPVRFRP
jgi:cytochrome P450